MNKKMIKNIVACGLSVALVFGITPAYAKGVSAGARSFSTPKVSTTPKTSSTPKVSTKPKTSVSTAKSNFYKPSKFCVNSQKSFGFNCLSSSLNKTPNRLFNNYNNSSGFFIPYWYSVPNNWLFWNMMNNNEEEEKNKNE